MEMGDIRVLFLSITANNEKPKYDLKLSQKLFHPADGRGYVATKKTIEFKDVVSLRRGVSIVRHGDFQEQ